MKRFFVILLVVSAFFASSCKDDSEQYIAQYFTDSEASSALKSCLTVSMDTAIAHLAVEGGFYNYNLQAYRINLPSSAQNFMDTINLYQTGEIDSLILYINRAAENSGSSIRTVYTKAINSLAFSNPNDVLEGGSNAATLYFQDKCFLSLRSTLLPIMATQLSNSGATQQWNRLLSDYYTNHGGGILQLDLNNYVTEQMMNGLFSEMKIEEANIRSDSSHRVTDELLRVFKY